VQKLNAGILEYWNTGITGITEILEYWNIR